MTQIRVRELASELNVSTQDVQEILEGLGKKVRGPSTVIGVSAAAKVRARFRLPRTVTSLAAVTAVAAPLETTVTGATEMAMPQLTEMPLPAAAAISQSLFLPPVAPTAPLTAARSTAAFANPFAVPQTRPAPARPAGRLPVPPPPRAVPNRVPTAAVVAEPEPDYAAEWDRRGFAKADQAAWIENGLRPAEAGLADRCQSADIAPTDLPKKLSGRTALQRLRDGEASTSVWARIQEAEQQPRRAGTKLTGRFQLS